MMRWLSPARVGMSVRTKLADMGYGARLFLTLLSLLGATLRRPRLLVEQERMRRELDLAREIQRDLLPDSPAADFPVHGLNLPAEMRTEPVQAPKQAHRADIEIGPLPAPLRQNVIDAVKWFFAHHQGITISILTSR